MIDTQIDFKYSQIIIRKKSEEGCFSAALDNGKIQYTLRE